MLAASQTHIRCYEAIVADQLNQLLSNDDEATNEPEQLSKLENQEPSWSADVQQARTHNTTSKNPFKGVRAA